MRCPDDERFALYAEGKLNEDERFEFLKHLRECHECSTLFALTYGRMSESANVCPDEESISSLAEGKISQHEREALLKHMAACKTCSAEFYLLRKLKPAKTATVRNFHSNKYKLIAIAALITLVIGLAGHNAFDIFAEKSKLNTELEIIVNELNERDISAVFPASAPEMAQDIATGANIAQNPEDRRKKVAKFMEDDEINLKPEEESYRSKRIMPSTSASNMAKETTIDKVLKELVMPMTAAPEAVQDSKTDKVQKESAQTYEVIYNGHDGDISEIIKLIQTITEKDESSAEIIAKSSSVVIKECTSMEEAQKIKSELEAAGARVKIR